MSFPRSSASHLHNVEESFVPALLLLLPLRVLLTRDVLLLLFNMRLLTALAAELVLALRGGKRGKARESG